MQIWIPGVGHENVLLRLAAHGRSVKNRGDCPPNAKNQRMQTLSCLLTRSRYPCLYSTLRAEGSQLRIVNRLAKSKDQIAGRIFDRVSVSKVGEVIACNMNIANISSHFGDKRNLACRRRRTAG